VIRVLRARNWGPFRGNHELLLGPLAYGVFARDERDGERSNWQGKSMTLEAVDFALHGRLNPDRHFAKDGWITEGESDGYVHVEVDCAAGLLAVSRSRATGKSGKVAARVQTANGWETERTGDEAELEIARQLGLSAEDFLSVAYFRQRQTAQLVLMRPEPRTAVVVGWAGVAPLETGEDHLRARFREAEESRASLRTKMEVCTREIAAIVQEAGEDFEVKFARLDETRAEHEAARKACEEAHALQGMRAAAAEFLTVQAEGKSLRKKIDETITPYLASWERQLAERQEESKQLLLAAGPLQQEAEQKRLLARGHFDGRCPVASTGCPVPDFVKGQQQQAQALADEAEKRRQEVWKRYAAADRDAKQLEAQVREAKQDLERIKKLRTRAEILLPSYERVEEGTVPDDEETKRRFTRLEAAAQEVTKLRAERQRLERLTDRKRAAEAELARLKAEDAPLAAASRARHEAAQVFSAARRRIGEGCLREVEAGANDVLSSCGVDLQVSASWAREGKDPAKQCPECGSAQPASAKVKRCPTCGAERGLQQVQKLELRLSRHSGAAEDLAGLALQVSASAWVRRRRGSAWDTLLIDEPFGACDAAHRRQVGAQLARILAGPHGARQSLVVAHQPGVLESLPGRIEIVRRGSFSEVKVVA
jgi:DNA repair exonuclease SbcCD ATPase subunit